MSSRSLDRRAERVQLVQLARPRRAGSAAARPGSARRTAPRCARGARRGPRPSPPTPAAPRDSRLASRRRCMGSTTSILFTTSSIGRSSAPISCSTAFTASICSISSLLGRRTIDDVQDQVGDERLLERRREALDELVRQAADEADRVGDEIAAALVLEAARRRVEGLEEAVATETVGPGERVQERRLADVRVPGERDRRRLASASAPCGARRAASTSTFKPVARAARSGGARSGGRSRAATRPGPSCRRRRRAARGAATCRACAGGCTRAAPARPEAFPRR